jgi:hypothetical protein
MQVLAVGTANAKSSVEQDHVSLRAVEETASYFPGSMNIVTRKVVLVSDVFCCMFKVW